MADKKGPAVEKRIKISKAQQTTLLEVLVAGLLLGAAVVLSVWLVRNIAFNTKVLTEQDKSISNFEQSKQNISTLEENVMVMSNNTALESVARESLADCYNTDGTKKDFDAEYIQAGDAEDKEYYLKMMRTCSALRVIPDALPNQENVEAALSSLNQLFNWAGVVPDSLSPDSTALADQAGGTATESDGTEDTGGEEKVALQVLPLNMTIESNDNDVFRALSIMERSIREFDVTSLGFEWSDAGGLSVNAQVNAYYAGESAFTSKTQKVTATEKKDETI